MSGWQLSLQIPHNAIDAVEATLLEETPDATPPITSSFEIPSQKPGSADWALDVIFAEEPSLDALKATMSAALAPFGVTLGEIRLTALPDIDWQAEALKHHAPVTAGDLYIYGSHHPAPPNRTNGILIDGGMAFGTGQHATTLGCLLAMQDIAKRRRVDSAFDLGCGSGILAIAAAKLWHQPVLASDIDPQAVRVASDNAAQNGVGRLVRTVCTDGVGAPSVREKAPFDLITANILAGPLLGMAQGLCALLAPGGLVVLSGILRVQERAVFGAYRARGLVLRRRYRIGEWSILVLEKPR